MIILHIAIFQDFYKFKSIDDTVYIQVMIPCMYTIFQDVILISFDRPDTLTNLDILSRQGALQKLLQILTSGCIYLPLSLTDLITRRIVRDSTQIVESLLAK